MMVQHRYIKAFAPYTFINVDLVVDVATLYAFITPTTIDFGIP
jgi:hypothetical protein